MKGGAVNPSDWSVVETDEEPFEPYATVDEERSGAVIVWAGVAWVLGLVIAAVVVAKLVR